jgi:putative component of membrane protein insertase Oxa1/YidC/SpoIIIJ protein YidD
VALVLLGVYRNTLARTDMDACAFEPSCSHYAQLAIDDAGFVRGILRGADRLLRDHPGVPYMDYNQAPDGKHFLDPVHQRPEPPCQACDKP